MTDPPGPPRSSVLIIENRSGRTVTLRDVRAEREIALFNDLPPEKAEAMPVVIAPGRWYRIDQLAGIDILIDGGRCARIGEQPTRLVIRE